MDREISSHLISNAKELAKRIWSNYSSSDRLLEQTSHKSIKELALMMSNPCLDGSLINSFLDTFDNFKRKFNVEIINCSSCNVSSIVDKYFSKVAPFEEKKDKKNEFPDAIAIDVIAKKFFREESYIVLSTDKGWESAFRLFNNSNLFNNISDVISFINNKYHTTIEKLEIKWIFSAFNECWNAQIEKYISDGFESTGFVIDDIFDADVNSVSVDDVELISVDVIEYNDHEAIIYISTKIEYSANVSYDDPNSWIKDDETKEIYYLRRVDGVDINRSEVIDFEITLDISLEERTSSCFFECSNEIPDTVYISINEDIYY